ncbi:MAG: hypothetical protein ACW7DW_17540, partial [Paraglaciecola chathamensis]
MFKLNVRSSAKLSALTLALTLAGCASGPHLAEKSLAQSAFFAGQNYADELNESGASNQWWQSYQSPQLDALVKQGLESNR